MKKLGCLCLLVCLCLLFAGNFTVSAVEIADLSVTQGCHTVDAAVPVLGNQQLIENAQAVILYEQNTQTMMYAWNQDTRVDPASLVKVMTAMMAVESGKLSDIVTVEQSVLDTVSSNAVVVDLVDGEQISLRDLVYCMMVGSGNDAAAVIADYIYPDSFVEKMNERAVQIGCKDTNFTNVHGLYDAAQYSTARDLLRILNTALDSEEFTKIFSTVHYTVTATNKSTPRELVTGNHLMHTETFDIYLDERVTGGRTGTAADDTRCLAVTAQKDDLNYISIILGSESEYNEDDRTVKKYGGFNETRQLLDHGFNGFKPAQVLYDGMVLKQISTNAGNLSVGTNASYYSVLPLDVEYEDLTFEYVQLDSAIEDLIEKGRLVSYVRIWYGGLCIVQADLYAMHGISGAELTWSRDNTIESGVFQTIINVFLILLGIAAGVVVIVLIIVVVRKYVIKTKAQNRIRRYRRGRRRNR